MSQYFKLADLTTGREYTFTVDITKKVVTFSMPDQPFVIWLEDPTPRPVQIFIYIADDRLNVDTTYPNIGNDDDCTPVYGLLSSEDMTIEEPKTLDLR